VLAPLDPPRQPSANRTRRQIIAGASLTASALLIGRQAVGTGAVNQPTYATGVAAQREAALPVTAPTLYLVDAPECKWCVWWDNKYLADFEQSEARARLRFVQLHAPRIPDSLLDIAWPEADRWARDAARDHHLHGTPLFVLVREHRFITGGNNARFGWPDEYWPTIRREVGL
jgi:hypothetical protein